MLYGHKAIAGVGFVGLQEMSFSLAGSIFSLVLARWNNQPLHTFVSQLSARDLPRQSRRVSALLYPFRIGKGTEPLASPSLTSSNCQVTFLHSVSGLRGTEMISQPW